jgi:hypothetical protein
MTQLPLHLPLSLDEQCSAAQKKVAEHVKRSAGQHRRAITRAFDKLRHQVSKAV